MNLIKELLKEHSKAQCNRIVDFIGSSPTRFSELVDVFLTGNYRITQRASWPLGYCVERHPELIKPHLKKIIINLKKPGLSDAVKRNTVRLLQFIEIPKSLQGYAAEFCFGFLSNPKETIAVRVFAMTVLANLAQRQPALRNELQLLIEDQLPYATAAFRSRASKVLRELH